MLVEQLAQYSTLWVATLLILGLLVGSFLNVVILRLPASMQHDWKIQCRELLELKSDKSEIPPGNIVYPASHCPRCKAPLKWWHNIPIVSYILLRGKCHACQETISMRYPLIETATAILTLLAGLTFPETAILPWVLVLLWALITMAAIDFDTQLLPDILTLPVMWLGLIFSTTSASFVTPTDSIIGAAAGYMVLWTIYQLHHRLTGREGMGYGDFKLLALIGAWLGWDKLPFVLLISAGTGMVITLLMMLLKNHDKHRAVSFGPYLAIAFLISLFWGDSLISVYTSYLGLTP